MYVTDSRIPLGFAGLLISSRSGDYGETQMQLSRHPRVGRSVCGNPVLQLTRQLLQPLVRGKKKKMALYVYNSPFNSFSIALGMLPSAMCSG